MIIEISQGDDGKFTAAERAPDQVVVYRDTQQQWRWRRVAPNNEITADSAEGYEQVRDCLTMATQVNAPPYILTVEGDTDSTLQVDLNPGQD